jgi:hypothetical protein
LRNPIPQFHAAAIRSRADWIPGLIDSQANRRGQVDGYQVIRAYQGLGLHLISINNPVESGILEVGQRMRSGKLKVFASLSKYLEQRRLYRRDEREQIVQHNDHLQDAARCLVNGIFHMKTKPKPPKPIYRPTRTYRGDSWWMAL